MKANPQNVALVVAVMLGGVHTLWAILVALGWAQALADFSMWAHMVHANVVIGPFDGSAAITVIVIASVIGYGIGFVAANVWNKVHAR